jgi:hypothetical protein
MRRHESKRAIRASPDSEVGVSEVAESSRPEIIASDASFFKVHSFSSSAQLLIFAA